MQFPGACQFDRLVKFDVCCGVRLVKMRNRKARGLFAFEIGMHSTWLNAAENELSSREEARSEPLDLIHQMSK